MKTKNLNYHKFTKPGLTVFIIIFSVLSSSLSIKAIADNELSAYAYLSPAYIGPVFEAFEEETGIQVNVEYMRANDLLNRLIEEGDDPKADIIFTMEAKRLASLSSEKLLGLVKSPILETAIPSRYRHPDGLWYGLSKWSRSIFYSTERVDPTSITSYYDLAKPEWRGRICARPSNKAYVQSLLASMLAHDGEAKVRDFVRGLIANFAREPIDLDIKQITGIADGICDIALANSYYFARLESTSFDIISGTYTDAKRLLQSVGVLYPKAEHKGVHMNISGYGLTKATKNRGKAIKLMEYLVRPAVQRLYADPSRDYPIVSGLKPHSVLQKLGTFDEDKLAISELAKHYDLAERISKEEGWLWK